MTHIFISPHPDDVVWSCGGRISNLINAGEDVLVVTIFDGNKSNDIHGEQWRTIASPRLRRLENQSALKFLGVSHISKGYIDAALRVDNSNYFLYFTPNDLFEKHNPADEILILSISNELGELVHNKHVHAPLGLGNHVDHYLVQQAILKTTPNSITWYEDFPYSFTSRELNNFTPNWHQVDFETWLTASLKYRSQFLFFYKNMKSFTIALTKHAVDRGREVGWNYAERTWVDDKTLST